jgi:hypothetical protein
MVSFLTANPDKAAAWAAAQGIAVSAVPTFLRELTPVLLRADTRVTNYGFAGGAATPRQSVLEAGTAVLVDKYGEPQAKCACGNPLNPPIALAGPIYVGSRWPGFTPGGVTVVVKNTTVIKIITIIDIRTGEPFGRPPGGGRDLPVPTTTTTPATTVPVTSPTAPPQTSPPVKPPPPPPTSPPVPAIWRLVDFTQTVAELPTAWTVNAQGGTARVSLPPNEGNYSWTVPQEIGPSGTTVTFGGSSVGNIAIDIQVSGDGNLAFNTADLRATAGSDQSVSKSAVVRVTNLEAGEVRLSYGMGFSVGVTYIYRRG